MTVILSAMTEPRLTCIVPTWNSGETLDFTYDAATKAVSVELRPEQHSKLVDVVAVEL